MALYLLPACLLMGCNGKKVAYPNPINEEWKLLEPQQAHGLVGKTQPLIPDVGQPIAFKALVKQSQSSITGNAREVKHVYQGRAKFEDVIEFYRRRLDMNGWKMGSDEHQDNGFVLNRTKGPERLRILMYPQGDRVTVVIMIGPIYNVPSGAASPNGPMPNLNLGSNG
ncbi:MAG TPA: hypothetical protein DCM28_12930 [Phycisphaerales bacterium]|nr:hypothetical protein [Phycisphaerales bacterium]HCD32099.1 hypothetical protein [Phycisphaerales bacterium]